MGTKIEWTDETWNPVTGCTPISPGCANCYAKRMARRLAGRCGYKEAPYHFDVTLRQDRLDEPLRWRKPRRVFVCSMGDLFHEDVPFHYIKSVWARMIALREHTFQVLTKRPQRMLEFTKLHPSLERAWSNIWLGITAENQEQADKRIPILLRIPAAVRFVSVEPMLDAIVLNDIREDLGNGEWSIDALRDSKPLFNQDCVHRNVLNWIICGAETGPGKRKMQLDWARSLRDQCQAAGVPFFFKKDSEGNHTLDGVVHEEFPQ